MVDVKCHGFTSSATSNLKGEPGEMLAKHQADVNHQYVTNCCKLDCKMGVGPSEEKLRSYGNPALEFICGHCDTSRGTPRTWPS